MTENFLSNEKKLIKLLIKDLSDILQVDVKELAVIEERIDKIILLNKGKSLEVFLNAYYSSLENEMITLFDKKITPAIEFGIKNDYFTFIGYGGSYNGDFNSKEIDENTYFSFDSISKILVSVIVMLWLRDGNFTFDSSINSYNPEFMMDASIEDILKFTALIRTDKRIDNLSKAETIEILKRCKEDIKEKECYKNFYQYNDIGYMILRLSMPDFLERLDELVDVIDKDNVTYKNIDNINNITGGKLGEEYITPDTKGRDILFPGHTGLYGNLRGLLNLFKDIFYTNKILTNEEKELLLRQPYIDPIVYDKDGNQVVGKNNSLQYMAKVAGVYRKPLGIISTNYNKLASCDLANLTTDKALASAGTCGSWVMGDELSYHNKFGTYIGGILTNPYSYVNIGEYPDKQNIIPNTGLIVNPKGIILGYQAKLNPYKELIAEYGILLELLTEYIKNTDIDFNLEKKYILIKRLKRTSKE